MQKLRCKCGRAWSEATYSVQRVGSERRIFYLCRCGQEWTVTERDVALEEPVTSEEQLEVHRRLEGDISISEILGG